jgi:hypothetical protein
MNTITFILKDTLGHSKNPADHKLKARYMELGQIRQTTTGQSDREWEDYAVF